MSGGPPMGSFPLMPGGPMRQSLLSSVSSPQQQGQGPPRYHNAPPEPGPRNLPMGMRYPPDRGDGPPGLRTMNPGLMQGAHADPPPYRGPVRYGTLPPSSSSSASAPPPQPPPSHSRNGAIDFLRAPPPSTGYPPSRPSYTYEPPQRFMPVAQRPAGGFQGPSGGHGPSGGMSSSSGLEHVSSSGGYPPSGPVMPSDPPMRRPPLDQELPLSLGGSGRRPLDPPSAMSWIASNRHLVGPSGLGGRPKPPGDTAQPPTPTPPPQQQVGGLSSRSLPDDSIRIPPRPPPEDSKDLNRPNPRMTPPPHLGNERFSDIQNRDGSITREEYLDVFVTGSIFASEPIVPTIRDVTFQAPRPNTSAMTLRRFPNRRVSYTFPHAVSDPKKLRIMRDNELVRLKEQVLQEYLSEMASVPPKRGPPQVERVPSPSPDNASVTSSASRERSDMPPAYPPPERRPPRAQLTPRRPQPPPMTLRPPKLEEPPPPPPSPPRSVRYLPPPPSTPPSPKPDIANMILNLVKDEEESELAKRQRAQQWREALLSGDHMDLETASRMLVGAVVPPKVQQAAKRVDVMASLYVEAAAAVRKRKQQEAAKAKQAETEEEEEEEEDDEEMEHAGPVPPVLKEDVWVQCDKCTKWRRLPHHVDTRRLPTRWYCSMNKYRPEMANCDAAEEAYTDPAAVVDPAELREKRRIKAWVKRLEMEDKYMHRNDTQGLVLSRGRNATDWIQCCNPMCGKWRPLMRAMDGSAFPSRFCNGYPTKLWFCWMNTWDDDKASCAAPQEGWMVPLRISSRRSSTSRSNTPVVDLPSKRISRTELGSKRVFGGGGNNGGLAKRPKPTGGAGKPRVRPPQSTENIYQRPRLPRPLRGSSHSPTAAVEGSVAAAVMARSRRGGSERRRPKEYDDYDDEGMEEEAELEDEEAARFEDEQDEDDEEGVDDDDADGAD